MADPLNYIFKAKLPLRFRWLPLAVFFGLMYRMRILVFRSALTPFIFSGLLFWGAWKYWTFGERVSSDIHNALASGSDQMLVAIPDKMNVLTKWYGWRTEDIGDLSKKVGNWEEWRKVDAQSRDTRLPYDRRIELVKEYVDHSSGGLWVDSARRRIEELGFDRDMSFLSSGSIKSRLSSGNTALTAWQASADKYQQLLTVTDRNIQELGRQLIPGARDAGRSIDTIVSRSGELNEYIGILRRLAVFTPAASSMADSFDRELAALKQRERDIRDEQARKDYGDSRNTIYLHIQNADFIAASTLFNAVRVKHPSLFLNDDDLAAVGEWIDIGNALLDGIGKEDVAASLSALAKIRAFNVTALNMAADVLERRVRYLESTVDIRRELKELRGKLNEQFTVSFKTDLEVYGGPKGRSFLDDYERQSRADLSLDDALSICRGLAGDLNAMTKHIDKSKELASAAEEYKVLAKEKGGVLAAFAPVTWAVSTGIYQKAISSRHDDPSSALIQINDAKAQLLAAYPAAFSAKQVSDVVSELQAEINKHKADLQSYNSSSLGSLQRQVEDVSKAESYDSAVKKSAKAQKDLAEAIKVARAGKLLAARVNELKSTYQASLNGVNVARIDKYNKSGMDSVRSLIARAEKAGNDYALAVKLYTSAISKLKEANGLAIQRERNQQKSAGPFGG